MFSVKTLMIIVITILTVKNFLHTLNGANSIWLRGYPNPNDHLIFIVIVITKAIGMEGSLALPLIV